MNTKGLDYTLLALVIIGAVNWGLIGLFRFDLVSFLFGDMSWLTRIIYGIVGIGTISAVCISAAFLDVSVPSTKPDIRQNFLQETNIFSIKGVIAAYSITPFVYVLHVDADLSAFSDRSTETRLPYIWYIQAGLSHSWKCLKQN